MKNTHKKQFFFKKNKRRVLKTKNFNENSSCERVFDYSSTGRVFKLEKIKFYTEN